MTWAVRGNGKARAVKCAAVERLISDKMFRIRESLKYDVPTDHF